MNELELTTEHVATGALPVLAVIAVIAVTFCIWRIAELRRQLVRATALNIRLTISLDAATRTREEFMGFLSHELRTPLNAIIGFSELISMHPVEGKAAQKHAEYAGLIHESGQQLLDMIEDLLEMSALDDQPDTPPDTKTISLPVLVGSVSRALKNRLDSRQITLETGRVPHDVLIDVDPPAIKRALGNLLQNAAACSPAGTRLKLRISVTSCRELFITVSDKGPAIPPAHAISPLNQIGTGNASIAQVTCGSGISLPLAQHLLQRHGGRIDIRPYAAGGNDVSLVLPPERVTHLVTEPDQSARPGHTQKKAASRHTADTVCASVGA